MATLDLAGVTPGFADPVHQTQAAFRVVMDAMARPGRIAAIPASPTPPEGVNDAAAAILLTLLDMDTPLWIDPELRGGPAETFLRFHCGCPMTADPQQAAFALASVASGVRISDFNAGTEKDPERSTTLILMCPALTGGPPLTIEGPGVRGRRGMAPVGLDGEFLQNWRDNQRAFQCGVDVLLTSGGDVIGLPRSACISEE